MVLLIILCCIALILAILVAINDEWEPALAFVGTLLASAFISFLILLIVNGIGYQIVKEESYSSYSIKLASLTDGTGIEGKISGGIFISRGYIKDTQNYSYYAKNNDGSFNLQKRDADKSTIWQDVSPDNAHVLITDKIEKCSPRWWLLLCGEEKKSFYKADFHVPEGSITNEYRLDAN